jgi:hypothetical protein
VSTDEGTTTRSPRPYWAVELRAGGAEKTVYRHASTGEEARSKVEESMSRYRAGGARPAGLPDGFPDTAEVVAVRLVSRSGSILQADDTGFDLRD